MILIDRSRALEPAYMRLIRPEEYINRVNQGARKDKEDVLWICSRVIRSKGEGGGM